MLKNKHQSEVYIDGCQLKLEDVGLVAKQERKVKLDEKAYKSLNQSRKLIETLLSSGEVIYGINTGFGKFKDVKIKPEDTRKLQRNLLLSHAAGVGEPLEPSVVRAAMLLRANSLAYGLSGVRSEVIELLLECLNHGIHPIVPEQGSLGASGDLAPLAHLSLVLIGEGLVEWNGQVISGQAALAKAGLKPIILEAKEGIALLNGTQIMGALGSLLTLEAEHLAKVADIAGAMSFEAQRGISDAFLEKVQLARPHPGQITCAHNLRRLIAESTLQSNGDKKQVQDAYSLRCIPQVHGASRQAFAHLRQVMEIEINSATDNPLVFADRIVSGGNFHGQPLALVLDYAAIALSELANISERRIERLVNPALSNGLPAFLVIDGGINSGYMITQYTAAALVSENKCLAHPASVDSIPTSANQEDHVSMGTIAGRKARAILQNTRRVLAIELMCAAQGLHLRIKQNENSQLLPGTGVLAAFQEVSKNIPFLENDREMHLDITKAEQLIESGALLSTVETAIGPLN